MVRVGIGRIAADGDPGDDLVQSIEGGRQQSLFLLRVDAPQVERRRAERLADRQELLMQDLGGARQDVDVLLELDM